MQDSRKIAVPMSVADEVDAHAVYLTEKTGIRCTRQDAATLLLRAALKAEAARRREEA
jgi:hypothetical protein